MTEDDIKQIKYCFKDEQSLYLAYMPFVQGGGLFIRTKKEYDLGSKVNLSVQIVDETEDFLLEGKVVWLTPRGAQRNKPPGIGIQLLGDNGLRVVNIIETRLAGMLKSKQVTDTI
tara:strand:- start:139 stop:483 length:345 start_codon:yes stop_codon:yes gene_type:complete